MLARFPSTQTMESGAAPVLFVGVIVARTYRLSPL
jgi:hypothetical protein